MLVVQHTIQVIREGFPRKLSQRVRESGCQVKQESLQKSTENFWAWGTATSSTLTLTGMPIVRLCVLTEMAFANSKEDMQSCSLLWPSSREDQ